jgi:predicted outer membrane repeat protein
VFFIAKEATVSIKAMTIQHGNPHDQLRYAGGILNQGTLTLSHSIVRNNQANCGGGIVSQGGVLEVINSTITKNTADGEAEPGLNCGSGGGIKLVEGGTLTLINSTLSHNRAKKYGGGLHISCESAATLINCTISQNQARRAGGGINVGGVVTLTNCTISQNTAQGISPFQRIQGKAGGGIAVNGTLNYENTLIANHLKNSGDCVLRSNGVIGVNTHNLVEDNGCSPAYSGDPMLGGLGNNGGDTQTHALLPGSPAIDVVPADNCTVDFDQRGSPRPVAQTSTDTPGDIGAFELQPE